MRTMPLSPIDVAFVGQDGYSIEFLLRFSRPLDEDLLAAALEDTLDVFWPLRGRIEADARAGLCVVESDAKTDFAVVSPRPALDSRSPQELVPFHAGIVSLPGEPLLRVRYGRVGDGAALSVHASHCLVDGHSYFHFLSALAAACRGELCAVPVPDHDRSKLIPDERELDPARHGEGVLRELLFQETGITWGEVRRLPRLDACRWSFLEFSDARLQRLLDEAAATSDARLSRHDVLAAHLWRTTAEAWGAAADTLSYVAGYDYRRVVPGLSPRYFGNAVRNATMRLPREEVLGAPLGRLAGHIRRATEAMDEHRARESLRCLAEIRLAHGFEAFARLHAVDQGAGFLVTNMSKMPLDALDCGSGPPSELIALTPGLRTAFVTAARSGVLVRLPAP
jgi:Transferase family